MMMRFASRIAVNASKTTTTTKNFAVKQTTTKSHQSVFSSTCLPASTITTTRLYAKKLKSKKEKELDALAEKEDTEVAVEDDQAPSEWTRAHITEEAIETLINDRTFEFQRRLEALVKRDSTYGDAYLRNYPKTQVDENVASDDLFETQYGMNEGVRGIESQAIQEQEERTGLPTLHNKPRFRYGMPTMIDPEGAKFARYEGKQFYNFHPFQYKGANNILQNEQTVNELSASVKQQIAFEKELAKHAADEEESTANTLLEELEMMKSHFSLGNLREVARLDAITSGLTGPELEDALGYDADGVEEEGENEHETDADWVNAPGRPLVMDGVEFWRQSKDFKERKFNNTAMNVPLRSDLFSTEAPGVIRESDIDKLYVISSNDYNTYFGELGLGGELDQTFDLVHQRAILLRRPVVPVIQYLTEMKENNFTRKDLDTKGFVFTGIRGGGKSACLTSVVHHAFKNNFLVFYIPSARYWTHGAHFVEPSVLLKGYFDAPIPSLAFMKQFEKANSSLLKSMKLSKSYGLPVEVGEKQPETLSELIKFGIASEDNAGVAFKLLLDELALNKEVPMVFAIDDYNFLHDYTNFTYGNLADFDTKMPEPVHATQLTLVRGLNRIMMENHPKRVFVASSSKKWIQPNGPSLEDYPLKPLNVPRYTAAEMGAMLDYYRASYYVYMQEPSIVDDLVYLTGAVPARVFKELSNFY